MTRTGLVALAVAALAACGRQGASTPAAEPPPAPAPLLAAALPPPPAWVQPFMGRIITQTLPQKETCAGATDGQVRRYAGAPAGSEVGGWGWDKQANRPVDHVLLTDEALRVWGAAQGGEERPDVPKNLPSVTSPRTGWRGSATGTSGLVVAWALVDDGRAICPLGEIEL
jgi:hypothetical protein